MASWYEALHVYYREEAVEANAFSTRGRNGGGLHTGQSHFFSSRGRNPSYSFHLCDLHGPDPALFPGARPLIIFFHGGPTQGDKSDVRDYCQRLAAAGCLVVNSNFSLKTIGAPPALELENQIWGRRQMAQEGREALKYGRDRIDFVGAGYTDGYSCVIVAGASGGGGVAWSTSYGRDDNYVMPDGTKLFELLEDEGRIDGVVLMWSNILNPYLTSEDDLQLTIENNIYGINYLEEDDPPVMDMHGTADTIAPYGSGQEIVRQAHEKGIYAQHKPIIGADHGPWEEEGYGKDVYVQWTLNFIARVLGNVPKIKPTLISSAGQVKRL